MVDEKDTKLNLTPSEIFDRLSSLPPEAWTYHHLEQEPSLSKKLGIKSSSNVLFDAQLSPDNGLKAVLYHEQVGAWWDTRVEQRIAIVDGSLPTPIYTFGAEALDPAREKSLEILDQTLFCSQKVRKVPILPRDDPEYLKKEYRSLVGDEHSIDGLVALVLKTGNWTACQTHSRESGSYINLEGKKIAYSDPLVEYHALVGPFDISVSERVLETVARIYEGSKGIILGWFWAGYPETDHAQKIIKAYLHARSAVESGSGAKAGQSKLAITEL